MKLVLVDVIIKIHFTKPRIFINIHERQLSFNGVIVNIAKSFNSNSFNVNVLTITILNWTNR